MTVRQTPSLSPTQVLDASAVVWVLIRIPLVIVGALGVVDLVRRDLSPWRAAPSAR